MLLRVQTSKQQSCSLVCKIVACAKNKLYLLLFTCVVMEILSSGDDRDVVRMHAGTINSTSVNKIT